MSEIYGRFANKQRERDAGTSISRFLLAAAILFLVGAIWRTAAIGLIFGLLMGVILGAITLFSPPLCSEEDAGMKWTDKA